MLGIAEKMRDKVAKADKVDDSITDELRESAHELDQLSDQLE